MTSADKPKFLITIDVEGDNIWSSPRSIATENAKYLGRFQDLCATFGFKPTYLTNYEMAACPDFQKFGKNVLREKSAEIGMHLHAWNTPPETPLTEDDYRFQPYLTEYPEDIMHKKIHAMTKLLEDTFGEKMVSHRGGRWALNETYARILADQGYLADCSVTPHISWKDHPGDPRQKGGPDYTSFPDRPYFLDLDNIRKAGKSKLLELPMTILPPRKSPLRIFPEFIRKSGRLKQWADKYFPTQKAVWLRPKSGNLQKMLTAVNHSTGQKRPYIEFMLHSSELMPGGSPNFKDSESIEALYQDLRILFLQIEKNYDGSTLSEYRAQAAAV